VAPNQQEDTHFSMERGMTIMSWVQVFLCTKESYQWLRGLNLLVIDVIHNTKRSLVSYHCSGCLCPNRR
jgi:hypothetical protein